MVAAERAPGGARAATANANADLAGGKPAAKRRPASAPTSRETREAHPPSGRAAHLGVTSPTKPAWRPAAVNAPVPEPSAPSPTTKPAKAKTGTKPNDGDSTPRASNQPEAPPATRLTPSKIQTVTILIVRHHKPRTAPVVREDGSEKPAAPAPVPIPLTFKRRVDEPHGEVALAELLPAMQAKLQLAVPVSGRAPDPPASR